MLEAFALLALLNVTDPPGDAGSTLSAPTAAVFRQRGAFDIRQVVVADLPTLTLSVTLESLSRGFPEALLEFYLQDLGVPGTTALGATVPGATVRPAGALPAAGAGAGAATGAFAGAGAGAAGD